MAETPGLVQRAARAVMWTLLGSVAQQAFQLLAKIILARTLTPADFGLAGMASILIAVLGVFQALGLGAAIVQWKERAEEAARTAFWILPVTGLLLSLVGWILATPAGRFFGYPEMVPVARVLTWTVWISSVSWVSGAMLTRSLSMHRIFVAETLGGIAYGLVAVPLAYAGAGVMSLAWGFLAQSAVRSAGLLVLSPFRPRWEFHPALARELLAYGRPIVSISVAHYIVPQVDVTLIGRFLGAAALGYYTLSLQSMQIVGNQVLALVRRVAFPTLAEAERDLGDVRRAFHAVVHMTGLVMFPAVVGAALSARWLVPFLFGEPWRPAVPLLALLAPAVLVTTFKTVLGTLLVAVGRPGLYERMVWAELVILGATLVPAVLTRSVTMVALAMSVAGMISLILYVVLVKRDLGWKLGDILGPLRRPAEATLFLVGSLSLLHIEPLPPALGTVIALVVGVAAYALGLYLLDREGVGRIVSGARGLRAAGALAEERIAGAPPSAKGD